MAKYEILTYPEKHRVVKEAANIAAALDGITNCYLVASHDATDYRYIVGATPKSPWVVYEDLNKKTLNYRRDDTRIYKPSILDLIANPPQERDDNPTSDPTPDPTPTSGDVYMTLLTSRETFDSVFALVDMTKPTLTETSNSITKSAELYKPSSLYRGALEKVESVTISIDKTTEAISIVEKPEFDMITTRLYFKDVDMETHNDRIIMDNEHLTSDDRDVLDTCDWSQLSLAPRGSSDNFNTINVESDLPEYNYSFPEIYMEGPNLNGKSYVVISGMAVSRHIAGSAWAYPIFWKEIDGKKYAILVDHTYVSSFNLYGYLYSA